MYKVCDFRDLHLVSHDTPSRLTAGLNFTMWIKFAVLTLLLQRLSFCRSQNFPIEQSFQLRA
jgi:hypothetical protein